MPGSSFDPFFRWIETSAFSVWMVESPSLFAFPAILAAHTIGMGLLAGLSVAFDLRLLGVAPAIPPLAFTRFLPFIRLGLWVNVVSGVALLLAYPTKALTNPVFYLKLALIGTALLLLRATITRTRAGAAESRSTKMLAGVSVLVWLSAITAGRLLAYTCTRLMVDLPCR
jgi:hypothetical protein